MYTLEKIAVLSDIHGNSPALQAVFEDISHTGCSKIYILGDIINGIDPHTCVQLIRTRKNTVCLKGNAEFYLLTPDLDDFPKRDEPLFVELMPLLRWFKSQLSESDLDWLQGLPDLIISDRACFVHDSPLERLSIHNKPIPGIQEKYQELCFHAKGITPELPDGEWDALWGWMEMQSLSQVFCGHTHRALRKMRDNKLICNVGSVGLPLDNDPHPCWVLLEENPSGEYIASIHRVDYEIGQMLAMVDQTSDYPDFRNPETRETYKSTLTNGKLYKEN